MQYLSSLINCLIYIILEFVIFFLVFIHNWKNLFKKFIISLLFLINLKYNNYYSIFVIINKLIKIINYKFVKIIINLFRFANVNINKII